jgi:hypothetical protein
MAKHTVSILKHKLKAKWKLFYSIFFIAVWYSVIFFLFFGWLSGSYSLYTLGFGFSSWIIYQMLMGDLKELIVTHGESKK